MNILVAGLGSMGKRRIRLIKRYNLSYQVFGVDTSEKRRKECEESLNIKTFVSLDEVLPLGLINCAFVCTSPLSHSEIITECLNNKIHVFSELNLTAAGYGRNIELARQNGLVLFLSSTFLYRKEIKHIKELTASAKCLLNYTYHVGQYLPDWHPWENYKDFFVGDKRTNGCREIFAIELPWLINVFGPIKNMKVIKSKISSLGIDYNDNYLVLLEHTTGHKGLLAVDVVSRKAVRNLEVFGENLYLDWDGTPQGLKIYDYEQKKDITIELYDEIEQLKEYSNYVVENAYFDEVKSFFESLSGNDEFIYTFEKDIEILKLIDKIEA